MNIELTIKERIVLLQIMKGFTGDIILMKVLRKTLDDIGFDAEELKEIDLKFDPNTGETRWSETATSVREFQLDEIVFNKIKESLKTLNGQNKITFDYIDLYLKIVGE